MQTLVGLFLVLILFSVFNFGQDAPPVTPVRETTAVYFGQRVVDQYRWLEDLKSEETQKWMREQSVYAREFLDKIPSRPDFPQAFE